jgi:phenylacetate-CoA ligase
MSRAMIGGRLVVPKGHASPPFWRYNLAERQVYMSAFHISPVNAPHYVKALNHYRPDYLVGYASSHFFLARMIHEMGLDVHQPKAVLTSSEKLTPEMRAMIESVYGCLVFDAYNGVEGSCLVSECEHHCLHISPDVGIVEILDDSGSPISPGEIGEVVTTGFLNFEQPLIRYKMGDLACYQEAPCPCGREMPVISELVGRLEDVVIGKDGREMVRFHGIFVGLPFVREGQVIQHDFAHFELRLVVDVGFGESEKEAIRKRFEERLGPVQLDFIVVNHIERTQNGKYKAVISHVKRAQKKS